MPNNNPAKLASLRKPDFRGSWWKEYYKTRTTMGIGTFDPVHVQEIAGNTLFKVKPEIRFESLPMVSPLYDGFTMRTKFYAVPIRLYIPELRKNRQLPWGSIPNFKFPTLTIDHLFDPQSDRDQVVGAISFAGSLLDKLGMAYGFINSDESFNNVSYAEKYDSIDHRSNINLLPLLAYLDCWMRGEYNPQDKLIPVLYEFLYFQYGKHRVGTYGSMDYDSLKTFMDAVAGYHTFPSTNDIEIDFFPASQGGAIHMFMETHRVSYYRLFGELPLFSLWGVPQDGEMGVIGTSDDVINGVISGEWSRLRNTTSNVGLLPTTYKGDYLSSWFNSEGIQRLEEFVVNNGDNFLSLRQKNADFMVELLSTISGDRYTDYLQFIFDSYLELKDHPILIGWDELHFGATDETVSTAQTDMAFNGVLGSVASKAREYSNKVKPISVKTKEPCLLMVCSTIIPNVVYMQGVSRFMLKDTFADLWHPQYDSRGFQRINAEEYYNPRAVASYSNTVDDMYEQSLTENYVAPYVPLGWEYMQHINTVKGGMKTERFRTWSNIRDFSVFSFGGEGNTLFYSEIAKINPLNGIVTQNGGDLDLPDVSNLESYFTNLVSTYIVGAPYNVPFEAYDAFDNQNFVVNFGFVVSQYQPITHNLITKSI